MKNFSLFSVMLIALGASAAEIGDLTSFSAGTPAKAAEVNKNFSDVKSAVNENYQRLVTEETKSTTQATQITDLQTSSNANTSAITTLQSNMNGKQNALTGSCEVGNTIKSINSDGSFVCTPILFGGVVSVSSPSYVYQTDDWLNTGECVVVRSNSLTVGGSAYSCTLFAPVDLPHSAKLVSLTCNAYDNLAGSPANVSVALQRVELFDDGPLDLLSATTAQGASVFVQTLTDNTVLPGLYTDIIDNGFYAYRIKVVFESDTVGSVNLYTMAQKLRLYGCQINYVAQPNGVPAH